MEKFSIDQLTLGEIAQIEEISGQSISVMSDDAAPKGKLMAAIAWLAKRREDPSFTLAQAEALSMTEFSAVMNPDPKGKSV